MLIKNPIMIYIWSYQMLEIANLKIICTDSTEISFKTKVCWFELSLAKTKFSLTLTVLGVYSLINLKKKHPDPGYIHVYYS